MQPEPILFTDPRQLIADAFRKAFRVPERLSICEAAEKYRVLENPGGGYSGPWRFDLAPYLRRPHDCLDRDTPYSLVAVMGPGQSAKSEIGNNWLLHTVICDPADMIMVGPDRAIVRDYVVTQIEKMIRLCPEMLERKMPNRSAENIHAKMFLGCNFFAVWPVISQMRARPVPRFRVDDFDALPEDIDGEGSAIHHLGARQTTFEGQEKGYVNSSPALGDERGIERLVASGTDERWFVRCLHCDKGFPLLFDVVCEFHRVGTPEDARESATVVCPECGGIHEPKDKPGLMARGAWCGPGQTLLETGAVAGELKKTSIASFRFDGLMGFASWGKLAEQWRLADLAYERAQDEGDLRSFYSARIGVNYVSRLAGEAPVKAEELAERAGMSGYKMGTVPRGPVCLTAAVDIQGRSFECAVIGWGHGLECWVIDRFPLLALDDGRTAIEPAAKPEHWQVLLKKLIWRRLPLAEDPEQTVPILNTAIDTGGMEGVTANAFQFWGAATRLGVPPTAITLVKGGNNPRARLLPPPTIDTKRKQGRRSDPDPELYVPNVNRLKDIVDARLRRREPGPGHIHLPIDFPVAYCQELTAEKKTDGVWTRPRGVANETLDLLIYATTAMIRLGGTEPSLDWVPDWARVPSTLPGRPAEEIAAIRPKPVQRRPRVRVRGGR